MDIMVNLGDLLHAYNCADVNELSDSVGGDCEPDMWVAEIPGGIEVGAGTGATGLTFPFTLGDFWALVDEVEQAEAQRIEKIGFPMSDFGTLGGDDRISVWSRMAREKLIDTARSYHAVITYSELAEHVQEASGVHTKQLMRYWIGGVLFRVAEDCGQRREPMLTALCVTQDGSVGGGYAGAVDTVYGYKPELPDDHAAEQRLECYRYFGAALPSDGGRPAVTPQVQARRDRERSARQPARRGGVCPSCRMEMPLSGICVHCS